LEKIDFTGAIFYYRCVVIATAHTEDAAMIHGNVPPLRPLCPFRLIAGLPAYW